ILERGQAWRFFFERSAMKRWNAVADTDARAAAEQALGTLAQAYAAATGDPSASRWLAELSALPRSRVAAAKTAPARWLEGAAAAASFETERASILLRRATGATTSVAPALALRIRAEAARQLYNLGENTKLLADASQLHREALATGDRWTAVRSLH